METTSFLERLARLGQILFAIGIIGIGVEHFIFEDFIIGRAPAWPESIPGQLVWAYLTGTAFLATGVAILTGKGVRLAALYAGVLILIWAVLRHVPVVGASSVFSSAWTKAGKALIFWSGSWVIAAVAPKLVTASSASFLKFANLEGEFIILGRICLGIFFLITGTQHFLFTEFVASLIPIWFPGNAIFWTYFAGTALLAGGVGLIIRRTARLAALLSGLMVFSWFWIVHIPRTFTSISDGIAVFEALAVAGIAFVIAGYLNSASNVSQ